MRQWVERVIPCRSGVNPIKGPPVVSMRKKLYPQWLKEQIPA